MKIKIPARGAYVDATIEDLQVNPEIYVFSDTQDLLIHDRRDEDMENTIFALWINCGKDKERAIMFDVEIDHLEQFASAILKNIQMVRDGYGKQIQKQTDKGVRI